MQKFGGHCPKKPHVWTENAKIRGPLSKEASCLDRDCKNSGATVQRSLMFGQRMQKFGGHCPKKPHVWTEIAKIRGPLSKEASCLDRECKNSGATVQRSLMFGQRLQKFGGHCPKKPHVWTENAKIRGPLSKEASCLDRDCKNSGATVQRSLMFGQRMQKFGGHCPKKPHVWTEIAKIRGPLSKEASCLDRECKNSGATVQRSLMFGQRLQKFGGHCPKKPHVWTENAKIRGPLSKEASCLDRDCKNSGATVQRSLMFGQRMQKFGGHCPKKPHVWTEIAKIPGHESKDVSCLDRECKKPRTFVQRSLIFGYRTETQLPVIKSTPHPGRAVTHFQLVYFPPLRYTLVKE